MENQNQPKESTTDTITHPQTLSYNPSRIFLILIVVIIFLAIGIGEYVIGRKITQSDSQSTVTTTPVVSQQSNQNVAMLTPTPTPIITPTPGSWSKPMPLSRNIGGTIFTALASNGATLHAVWLDNGIIMYRHSTDEGNTWSSTTQIGSAIEIPLDHSFVAEGTTLHLLFTGNDYNLYYQKSTDNGLTWSTKAQVAPGLSGYFFRNSIKVSNGIIHILWVNESKSTFVSNGLFYRKSLDDGNTWQLAVRMTMADQSTDPGRPALSLSGNNVQISWMAEYLPLPPCYSWQHCTEVFYNRSLNAGVTWETPKLMSSGSPYASRPDILELPTGDVVLVWGDARWSAPGISNNFSIIQLVAVHSSDNGTTWDPIQRECFTNSYCNHGMLAEFGSNVFLPWNDGRNNTNSIYSRLSKDNGRTWGNEELAASSSTSQIIPYSTMTPNDAQMLFVDNSVYYTRLPVTVVYPTSTP